MGYINGKTITALTVDGGALKENTIGDSKLASVFIKQNGNVAMTGNLQMGGNKTTNQAAGVDPNDGINKGQLDAAVAALEAGKSWQASVITAKLISTIVTDPPAEPVDGDSYVVPAGATGAWAALVGHLVEAKTLAWLDHGLVVNGMRLGIVANADVSGAFSGQEDKIATKTASSYSFYTPLDTDTVKINGDLSVYERHEFTYNGTTGIWIDGGIGTTPGGTLPIELYSGSYRFNMKINGGLGVENGEAILASLKQYTGVDSSSVGLKLHQNGKVAVWKGMWDAEANPTQLASGVGTEGDLWYITSDNLALDPAIDGITSVEEDDVIRFHSGAWALNPDLAAGYVQILRQDCLEMTEYWYSHRFDKCVILGPSGEVILHERIGTYYAINSQDPGKGYDSAGYMVKDIDGISRTIIGLGRIVVKAANGDDKFRVEQNGDVNITGQISNGAEPVKGETNDLFVAGSSGLVSTETHAAIREAVSLSQSMPVIKVTSDHITAGYIDDVVTVIPVNPGKVQVAVYSEQDAAFPVMNHARVGTSGMTYSFRMGTVNKKRLYFKNVADPVGALGDFGGALSGCNGNIVLDDNLQIEALA